MVNPPREHRESFLVRSYEVEPDGRLRIVVLLRMLQEAAWQHASMLGKGFSRREEGALFWVLSRFRLTMTRYPLWGDHFTIRTFPVGTQKIFAIRDFTVLDAAGEPLGSASSGWLIVDGGTGRPIRPQQIVSDIVTTPGEYGAELERIEGPGPDAVETGPFPVRFHDIDQYRHVNNASYLEWVLDAVEADRPTDHVVRELAIDFLKETLIDDGYRVTLDGDATGSRFEVRRTSDGEAAVRGSLTWAPVGRHS